jgi:hypothetical protein
VTDHPTKREIAMQRNQQPQYSDDLYGFFKTNTNTPLHEAVLSNNLDELKALLLTDNGLSKINHANRYGVTPLDIATYRGLENFIIVLVTYGANVKNALPGLDEKTYGNSQKVTAGLLTQFSIWRFDKYCSLVFENDAVIKRNKPQPNLGRRTY